jgi:hypothetical protein
MSDFLFNFLFDYLFDYFLITFGFFLFFTINGVKITLCFVVLHHTSWQVPVSPIPSISIVSEFLSQPKITLLIRCELENLKDLTPDEDTRWYMKVE